MQKVLLYLPDDLLTELERHAQGLGISRNRYINDAIAFYNDFLERQSLARQFAEESRLVREDSLQVLAEFEMLENKISSV